MLLHNKNCFVSGGAGFIGSNLVDRLTELGNQVTVYDNFSTGKINNLEKATLTGRVNIVQGDLLDLDKLEFALPENTDIVFHMAANADVRFGTEDCFRDFNQNVKATLNLLDCMKSKKIRKIVFASTGSVYGEANIVPTPENYEIPQQTSLYAASKFSAEAFIHAFCEAFDMQCWVYRFVSVLGPRYSHGHVYDFIEQLKRDPARLTILGDGNQTKSYMHVNDCVDGILLGLAKSNLPVNTLNLGLDDVCTVSESVSRICKFLNLSPKLIYMGGSKGWVGDNPLIHLDVTRIKKMGWKPKFDLMSSIDDTCLFLSNI